MPTMFESDSNYGNTTFKKVDLRQKRVRGAVFSECKFVRCDFSEADMQSCRFIKCEFDDCTMKMAKVEDCTFSMAHFIQCNLLGIDWTLCNWSEPSSKMSVLEFETCVLQYGIFFALKLRKAKFKACNAQEVNFSEADLTEADFTGTDLAGATFLKTNLTEANFVDAKNYALNLKDNTTKGAKFSFPEAMRLLYAMDIVITNGDEGSQSLKL